MIDYIERGEVLKILLDWCGLYDPPNTRPLEEALCALPAANVREVVRGKWERDSDNLPICSICGEIALQRMFVKVPHLIAQPEMMLSNFCPNCGAMMENKNE